jgi:hypothetical protein
VVKLTKMLAYKRFSITILVCGLIFLDFGKETESTLCTFISHVSLVIGPGQTQLLCSSPKRFAKFITLPNVRKPMSLRMSKETAPGSEPGVALPQRNLQQESGWLQVNPELRSLSSVHLFRICTFLFSRFFVKIDRRMRFDNGLTTNGFLAVSMLK